VYPYTLATSVSTSSASWVTIHTRRNTRDGPGGGSSLVSINTFIARVAAASALGYTLTGQVRYHPHCPLSVSRAHSHSASLSDGEYTGTQEQTVSSEVDEKPVCS